MADPVMRRASPRQSGRAHALFLAGAGVLVASCAPFATPDAGRVTMTSFAPLVQAVIPAVVNVSAVQKTGKEAEGQLPDSAASPVKDQPTGPLSAPPAFDELLRRFLDEKRRQAPLSPGGLALGSGFVIDPNGYIVTDNHVLENASRVTVTFHDATQVKARIVGRDALTDLALLKVDTPHPLAYVVWGNSDAVRVGDWVLAVGNPFGLDDTVSSGIISARGRDIHSGPYDDFLQIDASINRGNSGGPTFDLDGKVIGINSAIYSPNGGSVGIGFAIPANLARPVVEQLKDHGRVARGWLGVQIQLVTPDIAQGFGLSAPQGALVAGISPGGPAARAGFEPGDVIQAVEGHEIRGMRELPLIVAGLSIGQPAEVTVWRHNRAIRLRPLIEEMSVQPDIDDPEAAPDAPNSRRPGAIDTDLRLGPLSASLRRQLGIPKDVGGAVVAKVGDDSPLAGLDLLPGDVVEMINQQVVASPEDAREKLRAAAAGGKVVLILVNRHGGNHYLALSAADHAASG